MKYILKSIITVIGIMASFSLLGNSEGISDLYNALINNPYLVSFAFVGLIIFFKKIDLIPLKTSWLQKLISIVFSCCTWLSVVYKAGLQTINRVLIGNIAGVFYSVLYIVAFYLIIESIQKVITFLYNKEKLPTMKLPNVLLKVISFYEKRVFLFSFLFLLVIYTFIAMTAYPGVFMGDTLDQIMQFLGYADKAAAHPVLSSIFIGSCIKLGIILGSANLGMFLYTFLQMTFLAFSIAFSLSLLSSQTKNKTYVFFSLILFALLPSIQGTILLATKDIVYSAFVLLFITTLCVYFYNKKDFFQKKLMILYFLSIIFMMLFRYNTLYFIILTILIYLIGALLLKINFLKAKSIIPITIIALLSGSIINTILVDNYVEVQPKPNRREMLSVPFQHTARFIRYHEDEISENDKAIINSVLDYETLKSSYNPYRSDPVKRTHNEAATAKELRKYFKLVLKQTVAHPVLAMESILVSHSNLFNINQSMNSYYDTSLLMGEDRTEHLNAYNEIGFKESAISLRLNRIRVAFYNIWDRMPILSQLNNYGSYVFLLFAMMAVYIRDKKYLYAAILIPLFSFLATLLAGPITIGYIRYSLPIILGVIIIFGFFLETKKKNNQAND